MKRMLKFLDGKKTYIGAVVGALIAILEILDVPVPVVDDKNAAVMLLVSYLSATLRRGEKTEAEASARQIIEAMEKMQGVPPPAINAPIPVESSTIPVDRIIAAARGPVVETDFHGGVR